MKIVLILIVMAVLVGAAVGAGAGASAAPVLILTKGGAAKWKNFPELQQFATKGDPRACFELGCCYLEGGDVVVDVPRAIGLFEQAAKGGIADASFRIGKIYLDGTNVPVDYARALEYYTVAARAGVLEAEHNIGAMLVGAHGVERDFTEGLAWLIVATKSGDTSDAESRVRARLAKRPAEIQAAESRAVELLKDLSHATVLAVVTGEPLSIPKPVASPPVIATPVAPLIEKPVFVLPKIEVPVPMKLATPKGVELPVAPTK